MAQRLALGDHLRQLVPADRFAQGRLGAQHDGLFEILHFEDALLGVPYQPEDNGVHIDRHGVARQGRFGFDIGDANALVDVAADRVDHRHNQEKPRAAEAAITSQAQYGGLLPLLGHLDREEEVEADENAGNRRAGVVPENGCADARGHEQEKQEQRRRANGPFPRTTQLRTFP